jgi:murein tripeptide amidase MpaA
VLHNARIVREATGNGGSLRFDRYLNYEELTGALKAFAAEHPGLCELVSAGESREGRSIWLLEITNHRTGPAAEKPAFWVDGNTHAGEVTGSMCALYLIQTLLEGHDKDDLITRLLDEQTFYVLPRLSPDGAERYLNTPHTLRASTRPWPEPEEEPGLHAQDLDGDGHIVQMRVEDPNGEWKKSDKDERLMVPRKPDEAGGTYYRVYKEGVFRDYDGFERKIARPLYGLDMNRQYPYGWREEHEQRGAGPYPLSEPEARSQVEAVLARKNVFSVHTYHTFCGAILRPFSDKDDLAMPEQDLAVLKAVGERGTELTGYPNISVYHDFRYDPKEVITGAFDDWAYSAYGVLAYTIEFWSMAKAAGVEVKDFIEFFRDPPEEASLAMLRWNDEELSGEGFVGWREFEQLTRFALAHASCAPRLEAELKVEALSDGLRKIVLDVENTGYLPTNVTRIAVDKKVAKPVKAEIKLPESATIVSGEREVDLGHLAGRSALAGNRWKSPGFFEGLPSDYARRVEWVVKSEGNLEVEVRSEKAGTVRLEG